MTIKIDRSDLCKLLIALDQVMYESAEPHPTLKRIHDSLVEQRNAFDEKQRKDKTK